MRGTRDVAHLKGTCLACIFKALGLILSTNIAENLLIRNQRKHSWSILESQHFHLITGSLEQREDSPQQLCQAVLNELKELHIQLYSIS